MSKDLHELYNVDELSEVVYRELKSSEAKKAWDVIWSSYWGYKSQSHLWFRQYMNLRKQVAKEAKLKEKEVS